MDSDVDPLCRLCLEDDETPEHVFWFCPALDRERKWLSIAGDKPHDWNLDQVDRLLRLPSVVELSNQLEVE